VRGVPAKDKGRDLPFRDGKLGYRRQVFSLELDIGGEEQAVWAGDRPDAALRSPHPRHDRAVVETDNELQLHWDLAALSFDDPHQRRRLSPHGHTVD
jgi:hypothetical protein